MGRGLFGTSGIRGVVNVGLPPQLALKVGQAVGSYVGGGFVVIGHDTRTSCSMLESALVSGFLSVGSDVKRMGLIPTPALAYLTRVLGAASGAMITASHNPPEYNGIKLFNRDSMPYTGKQQVKINKMVSCCSFEHALWQGLGSVVECDELFGYVDMVLGVAHLRKVWRVVLDPGCGAASEVAPMIFRELGCDVLTINSQPDGFFPGRSPEPSIDSLLGLCEVVRGLRMDVGIAYDGDGDRMVVVDGDGRVVSPDRLLAAYAGHIVRRSGGGIVVTHIDSSMCIDRVVESYGGRVVRTRVGDVDVAASIRRFRALFGGEPAGSWIHPKYLLCPDGVLSSALLLVALEFEGESLSEFVSHVPIYPVIRKKVNCPDKLKYSVMRLTQKRLMDAFPEVKRTLKVDGIRLELEDGWMLVRPSGTEPVVRITVEAASKELAEGILKTCTKIVESCVGEALS